MGLTFDFLSAWVGKNRIRWCSSHLALKVQGERDFCHITGIVLGVAVSPLPSMCLPPHHNTWKNLFCLQVSWRTSPFEPGWGKRTKAGVVLNKKNVLTCVHWGHASALGYTGKKWVFFLVICASTCVHSFPFLSGIISHLNRSRPAGECVDRHSKGGFVAAMGWARI